LSERIYVDTSLLTAYYCPERDSELVQAYLTSGIDIAISRLTETELASALSKKVRLDELKSTHALKVLELFDSHVTTAFELLPVTVADLSAATRYIRGFDTVLRTLDAIHTAIAARENVTLATADVRLAEAATILGISTKLVRGE